jgi:DNA-binding transcriptional regulator YiaG
MANPYSEPEVTSPADVLRKAREKKAIPSPRACRAIRQAAGVSLRDVGRALGCSYSTVSLWESGRNRPGPGLREAYAELLDQLRRVAA